MWCSRLRIHRCHCLGHCCGMGLIPGPTTSICCRHSQKKKRERERENLHLFEEFRTSVNLELPRGFLCKTRDQLALSYLKWMMPNGVMISGNRTVEEGHNNHLFLSSSEITSEPSFSYLFKIFICMTHSGFKLLKTESITTHFRQMKEIYELDYFE